MGQGEEEGINQESIRPPSEQDDPENDPEPEKEKEKEKSKEKVTEKEKEQQKAYVTSTEHFKRYILSSRPKELHNLLRLYCDYSSYSGLPRIRVLVRTGGLNQMASRQSIQGVRYLVISQYSNLKTMGKLMQFSGRQHI